MEFEAADFVVCGAGSYECFFEFGVGDVEFGHDAGHGVAAFDHVAGALADAADRSRGFDEPVVVADEVANFTFAEDCEEGGEGAFGGVPGAAGFDEGDVDATEEVFVGDVAIFAAHFAAHQFDEALVLAIQISHALLFVACKRGG